jgi:hypothetical protein
VFESNNLNSKIGFWPFCNVSVVTIDGIILMRRSAFLFPKDADSCSCVNPSPKAGFVQSEGKIEENTRELTNKQIKEKEKLDKSMK